MKLSKIEIELLNKYFGKNTFDGSLGLHEDVRDKEPKHEFILSYIELIQKNKIESNSRDLLEILYLLSHEWVFTKDKIELAEPITNYFREEQLLRKILLMDNSLFNISRIEFGDQGGLGQITNRSLIETLIKNVDAKALWNDILFKKEIKLNQQKKNHTKKIFIKGCLMPLFEYLKNETSLGNGSENDIYRFIKDFCCLAGVDWDVFSTQDPASYLKKTFHVIKNHK